MQKVKAYQGMIKKRLDGIDWRLNKAMLMLNLVSVLGMALVKAYQGMRAKRLDSKAVTSQNAKRVERDRAMARQVD